MPVSAGQPDGVTSFTSAGPRLLFQSLELFMHFKADLDSPKGFIVDERLRQGFTPAPPTYTVLPLQWSLGLGYGRVTSETTTVDPSVLDEVLTGTGSLTWEVTSRLSVGVRANYDSIAIESYTHGLGLVRVDYNVPLPSWNLFSKDTDEPDYEDLKSEDDEDDDLDLEMDPTEYDPDDARQYYKYEMKKKFLHDEGEQLKEEDVNGNNPESEFPQLRVSYELGVSRHTVGTKFFRKPSSYILGHNNQPSQVTQFYDGIQLSYLPQRKWTYSLALGFYRYNGDANQFLSQIEAGDSLTQSVMNSTGWSQFASRSLAFPTSVLQGSVAHELDPVSSLTVILSKVSYASLLIPATYSLNPIYYRNLAEHWRAGLGIQGTVGGVNSPFFVGSLEVDYRF